MYQVMYVEKNCTLMGVFTNFGIGTAGLDVLCRHTKNILPRDREGYDGFNYTDEKLSTRRIQWCGLKNYIFFF